ncbi:MAG: hypothetical protein AB7P21_26100 [Lautropia sp.]
MATRAPIRALRLPADHPLQLVLGLTIWSLWFVVVYAAVSLACASGHPPVRGALNLVLGALSLSAAALLGAAGWRCRQAACRLGTDPGRRVQRFVAGSAAVLHAVAAFATVFVALPLAAWPPCL